MTENDNINNGYSPSDKPHTGSLDQKLGQMHADRREEYTKYSIEPEDDDKKNKKKKNIIIGIIGIVGVIAIGFLVWFLVGLLGSAENNDSDKASDSLQNRSLLGTEFQGFDSLEMEFNDLRERNLRVSVTDSMERQQLNEKISQYQSEVESLRKQLQDAKNMSAAEIQSLNKQIALLRELIKHYLEEIDRLNKENEDLRTENTGLKQTNEQIQSERDNAQAENRVLNERMTLAEKLNVTGTSMVMLNKKDKVEKKLKNAKKFQINFTIPQNNSTPPGTKTIFAVIKSPTGEILPGGNSFSFEGGTVNASAQMQVDYGGEEIGGLKMYYDITSALSPGTYSVQLFCDGYELMSHPLEVSFK